MIVKTNTTNSIVLKKITDYIKSLSSVDSVNFNEIYVDKLSEFVSFLHYITTIIQMSCIVIIAITIFNTIRLQMFINRDEILVSRLIGASNMFIMRPLTYVAIIQITISACFGYLSYKLCVSYMNIIINNYSHFFGNKFHLISLNLEEIFQVYAVLCVFTIFAVFTAVRSVFKHNTLN